MTKSSTGGGSFSHARAASAFCKKSFLAGWKIVALRLKMCSGLQFIFLYMCVCLELLLCFMSQRGTLSFLECKPHSKPSSKSEGPCGCLSGRPCVSWPLDAADTFLARKLLVSHHGASWGIIHIFIFALITFALTDQTSGFLMHTPASVYAALLFVVVYISWCLPVSVQILSGSRRNHCSLDFILFYFLKYAAGIVFLFLRFWKYFLVNLSFFS